MLVGGSVNFKKDCAIPRSLQPIKYDLEIGLLGMIQPTPTSFGLNMHIMSMYTQLSMPKT